MENSVGNTKTLLHTKRIFAEQFFITIGQAHHFQGVFNCIGASSTTQLCKDFKIFCTGQIGIKSRRFDDSPDTGVNVLLIAFDVSTKHIHLAGSNRSQAQNHFHNGSFSGSVASQQPVNASFFYMKINILNGGLISIHFCKLFCFD